MGKHHNTVKTLLLTKYKVLNSSQCLHKIVTCLKKFIKESYLSTIALGLDPFLGCKSIWKKPKFLDCSDWKDRPVMNQDIESHSSWVETDCSFQKLYLKLVPVLCLITEKGIKKQIV